MKNTQLIWNIFSWISHFNGVVKCYPILSTKNEHWLSLETKESYFSFNLNSKSYLLAANCILTWWANMGVDNNYNGDGENIFDFDLTKKKNRDKFVA